MNFSFAHKTAVITGAASGMGLATAKAFAQAGAKVALLDWNKAQITQQAELLQQQGLQVIAVQCDVSQPEQVAAAMAQVVQHFGGIDYAYNNAGVQNELAETADTTLADYQRVMGVNLQGIWSCMKYELQYMRQQQSGAIVNCSSIGGLVGGAANRTIHFD